MNPRQLQLLRLINQQKSLAIARRRAVRAGIPVRTGIPIRRPPAMVRSARVIPRGRPIVQTPQNRRAVNMARIQRLNNMAAVQRTRIQRPVPIQRPHRPAVAPIRHVPFPHRANPGRRQNQAVPSPQSLVFTPPPRISQKYAILVGINYKNTAHQLNGCINDIQDMKDIMMKQYGFSINCILTLTDESIIRPTRDNIMKAFKRIQDIARIRNHTIGELWFVYSGHGTWSVDLNGDETDARDERILSLDLKTISDDELNTLFKAFPQETKVVSVFDSCYSGTVMDCRLLYNRDTKTFDTSNSKLSGYPNWISLSACRDNQESEEGLQQVGGGGGGVSRYNGYFIRSLIDTLKENNYRVSYENLLNSIQEKIVQKGGQQRVQISANSEVSMSNNF